MVSVCLLGAVTEHQREQLKPQTFASRSGGATSRPRRRQCLVRTRRSLHTFDSPVKSTPWAPFHKRGSKRRP